MKNKLGNLALLGLGLISFAISNYIQKKEIEESVKDYFEKKEGGKQND